MALTLKWERRDRKKKRTWAAESGQYLLNTSKTRSGWIGRVYDRMTWRNDLVLTLTAPNSRQARHALELYVLLNQPKELT